MDYIPDKANNQDFFLWEQMKQGNKSALHKVYTGNYAAMLDYGLRLIGDRDLVKECIQQVFKDMIRRLDKMNQAHPIRFYLLSSLRQHLFDKTESGRTLKAKSKQMNGNGFHYNPEFFSGSGKKEDAVKGSNGKDNSNGAGLNFREKEAMYLKFHHQLNDKEISRMIGLTDASARELLFNALRKYRTRRSTSNPQ
ncbi:MAG: sigma-70 family RNA polymerase sigma factor [Bacteroidales bacterium]|nr:sigma-70 family RNA polymerase sigma factor [Bacteroidales bacterium]